MRVKFWGVRGSTPTPQAGNMRYGGNTSCVEVRFGNSIYIFDCGTGFRLLGHQLESEAKSKGAPVFAHVFVSHFHWDHIQGMPFFRPLYGMPPTGVACANLGRQFIGIELNEEYFETACVRIEAAQNQGRLFA